MTAVPGQNLSNTDGRANGLHGLSAALILVRASVRLIPPE